MPGNRPHYGRWPQHDFTSLKKLRPQSVTSRIQPGSDVIVCAEMDEQWGYVGVSELQLPCFTAVRAEIALMSGSAFAVTHHPVSS